MTWTDADRFLMFLRDNPTLMPSAAGQNYSRAMESRSQDGAHRCLRCGAGSQAAMVAGTMAGPRWLDLCMPDYVWIRTRMTVTL